MKELVSVIIPAYNAAASIVEAVDSVLAQTYDNIEILVVDDGSTDDTREILDEYAESGRVRYLYKKNGGPASARNEGINNAHGRLLAFLDADDVWCDHEKIERQIEFLTQNSEYGMVGTMHTIIDVDGRVEKNFYRETDAEIRKFLLQDCQFNQSSVVVRKEVFEAVGVYKKRYLSEDFEMWLRVGLKYKFANIPFACVEYRKRVNGRSQTAGLRNDFQNLAIAYKYRRYYPNANRALVIWFLLAVFPRKLIRILRRNDNIRKLFYSFQKR